eukprot:scaffold168673_cov20-Tisochrysis_lutea.AAC.3
MSKNNPVGAVDLEALSKPACPACQARRATQQHRYRHVLHRPAYQGVIRLIPNYGSCTPHITHAQPPAHTIHAHTLHAPTL